MNTEKSPEAFRTISEVSDWLGTPAHVLRFWESRFREIKPVKRAGGRRYYRPADMELLGGIKKLLHEDGMTIRGVQKLLREQGVRRVADLSPPLIPEGAAPDPSAPPAPRPAAPTGRRDGPADRESDGLAGAAPTPATPPLRPGPPWSTDATPGADAEDEGGTGPSSTPSSTPAEAAAPEADMVEDAPAEADASARIVPFVLDRPLRPDPPEPAAAPGPAEGTATPDLFATDPGAPAKPDPDPEPDLFAMRDPAPEPGPQAHPDPRPDSRPDPRPAPAPARPAQRLPAIPPDPDDAAPLPATARPPLRGFRRPHGKPDARLSDLFGKLAALRDRMGDR